SDIAAIAEVHPFTGMLSNMGIFLWCVSATVCFFAAATLHCCYQRNGTLNNANQRNLIPFMVSSGLLSTYLMLDDTFLIHEEMAQSLFGIDEKVVFVMLGLTVMAYLVVFHRVILQTKFQHLLAAFVFLSLSVVIDSILQPWFEHLGEVEYFLEDGAKWLGIVSWSIYYSQTAFTSVLEAFSPASTDIDQHQ
ncbi:MAG: hypothetical protein AAGJ37_11205, partial [Pseudomonadota bacterium]